MRVKVIGATVLALAGLGALAAIGLGGEGNVPGARLFNPAYKEPGSSLHRVSAPSARATVSATAVTSGKPRIRYLETSEVPINPNEALGDTLPCPNRNKVLGGYFASDGTDVALTFSAPVSSRRWFVGVTKIEGAGGTPATAIILGVVCASGVR